MDPRRIRTRLATVIARSAPSTTTYVDAVVPAGRKPTVVVLPHPRRSTRAARAESKH